MNQNAANELKQAVQGGRPVFGVNLLSRSPVIIEALGTTDIDFLWIDLEHTGPSPYDSPALERLVRAAEIAGIELLVRIPSTDPKMINAVLDTGVRNVLLSRVEDPSDVKTAIRGSMFASDGPADNHRGIPLARSTGWQGPTPELLEHADENVFIGIMIETVKAVEQIDELLSIDDLGFVFWGPGDLSVAAGHPLDTTHQEIQAHLETVRTRALESGVPIGRIRSSTEEIQRDIEDGFTILRVATDAAVLTNEVKGKLRAIGSDG